MKNKKIIIIVISILIVIALIVALLLLSSGNGNSNNSSNNNEDPTPKENVLLIELDEYKNLDLEKVNQIIQRRYTEGGMDEKTITSKTEIENIYNAVTSIKVGEETGRACEDNTTVYIFDQDDEKIKVEIECDWLVIGKKRYTIVR